jgi:hypothetical protein
VGLGGCLKDERFDFQLVAILQWAGFAAILDFKSLETFEVGINES